MAHCCLSSPLSKLTSDIVSSLDILLVSSLDIQGRLRTERLFQLKKLKVDKTRHSTNVRKLNLETNTRSDICRQNKDNTGKIQVLDQLPLFHFFTFSLFQQRISKLAGSESSGIDVVIKQTIFINCKPNHSRLTLSRTSKRMNNVWRGCFAEAVPYIATLHYD